MNVFEHKKWQTQLVDPLDEPSRDEKISSDSFRLGKFPNEMINDLKIFDVYDTLAHHTTDHELSHVPNLIPKCAVLSIPTCRSY